MRRAIVAVVLLALGASIGWAGHRFYLEDTAPVASPTGVPVICNHNAFLRGAPHAHVECWQGGKVVTLPNPPLCGPRDLPEYVWQPVQAGGAAIYVCGGQE